MQCVYCLLYKILRKNFPRRPTACFIKKISVFLNVLHQDQAEMDLFYNEKKNLYRSPTESNPSLFQLTRLQIDSESKHQQKEQFHHGRWVTALLGRTKRKLNLI